MSSIKKKKKSEAAKYKRDEERNNTDDNNNKTLQMKPLLNLVCRHEFLFVLDVFLCAVILLRASYTEIDWIAYMQEVKGFLDGQLDYTQLRGDTGPLVYPAGFVYFYSALYYLTDRGANVALAQWIFCGMYLLLLALVLFLYRVCKVPFGYAVLLIVSRRVHSLFLLRLFNDGVAMFFLYLAVVYFVQSGWKMGSLLFSLAVSIKMNVLLFAPGLLVVYCASQGPLEISALRKVGHVVGCLSICAFTQLFLGLPFLVHDPAAYLSKAFELSRVFTFKWTVNYKFLSEQDFQNPQFGMALLGATLLSWLVLYWRRWSRRVYASNGPHDPQRGAATTTIVYDKHARNIVLTLFESNMIGIIFSRTMHYQFYVWFFHQVPLLLALSCRRLPWVVKLLIWGGIEFGFSVYPSSEWSSAVLMSSLAVFLVGLLTSSD